MMQSEGRQGYLVADAMVGGMEADLVAWSSGGPANERASGDIPNGGVSPHGFPHLKDSPAWALAPPGDDLSQLGWAMSEAPGRRWIPRNR